MKVAADRVRKGQQKMRALVKDIRDFSDACRTVKATPVSGGAADIEHIDDVLNSVDSALVVIRTLDLEVFEKSDPQAYRVLRSTDPQGRVVRALTALRNQAVHHHEIIDVALDRIVGPVDDDYIIFPKWKHRADLPTDIFQSRKGQTLADYIASYDTSAAGRFVLDTLFDAFSFFDKCDPSVADRGDEGKLRGFLLPPLPTGEYHRLGPDWPDSAVVDHNIRTSATTEKPHGTRRDITGRLSADQGIVYCGHTVEGSRRNSFTESEEQIKRDVMDLNYLYHVVMAGTSSLVIHSNGELEAGGTRLEDAVPELTGPQLDPWKGWWHLCVTDANYYRRQRRGT